MRDIVTILVAALFAIAVMGAFALAYLLPTPWSRERPRMPARKGGWLALTAVLAFIFAWGAFSRLHATLALQSGFVAWALGGSCLAVAAPWLICRTRWLRIQGGRPLNALGRLIMLLLLESLAATICIEDLRDWFPSSPAAPALQSAGAVTSTILLIVFIGMLPLGMMDMISQRVPPER